MLKPSLRGGERIAEVLGSVVPRQETPSRFSRARSLSLALSLAPAVLTVALHATLGYYTDPNILKANSFTTLSSTLHECRTRILPAVQSNSKTHSFCATGHSLLSFERAVSREAEPSVPIGEPRAMQVLIHFSR